MLSIPSDLQTRYRALLREKGIPLNEHAHFQSWLRYYLDFCHKYHFSQEEKVSLSQFLRKLQEKKQIKAQQEQATSAITLYFELISAGNDRKNTDHPPTLSQTEFMAKIPDNAPCSSPGSPNKEQEKPTHPDSKPLTGVSWMSEYAKLTNEIQVRHYSQKTLKVYKGWLRQFQTFTRKTPELLSVTDVKDFLTFLAVNKQVSSSTQNQAFNALLFVFRHVLGKEFGKVDGLSGPKEKGISRSFCRAKK